MAYFETKDGTAIRSYGPRQGIEPRRKKIIEILAALKSLLLESEEFSIGIEKDLNFGYTGLSSPTKPKFTITIETKGWNTRENLRFFDDIHGTVMIKAKPAGSRKG